VLEMHLAYVCFINCQQSTRGKLTAVFFHFVLSVAVDDIIIFDWIIQ